METLLKIFLKCSHLIENEYMLSSSWASQVSPPFLVYTERVKERPQNMPIPFGCHLFNAAAPVQHTQHI